jgi:predicted dienelactone hydrolase
VGQADFIFVDESRPTGENRGVAGKPERTFPTTIWYPQDTDAGHPLIVHSHGILSNRAEMPYLTETLASYGYVVVAADYPLSSGATEGGATGTDVVNQPADVSFLIDSVLALSADEKPFDGNIDQDRIGLSGYSLGGLTTNLTTYHVRLRDPRVSAALTIAGLSAMFSPQFFATTDIPYLAIAGTADALLAFQGHAADIPSRVGNASLVAIDGGSHLGFIGLADPLFRFMHNPDTIGCEGVLATLEDDPNAAFDALGTVAEGVDLQRGVPEICGYGFAEAVHPGRQRMITQIAVLSFFESVFNEDETRRSAAQRQLSQSLAADFDEVTFTH